MPNQLATSKRRQSLAEHEAVLTAIAALARREKTSVMALLREAARELVRRRAASDAADAAHLRELVWAMAPRMPARFTSAAQVARFKRAQREFDRVVLDLDLARPADVQARNSIAPGTRPIRIAELDRAHAAAAR
jgi:hypothetical protein